MKTIGYNKIDIKTFYEINKTTKIVVDNAIGNTESTEITEVINEGSIFGPTMSCATTAKINDVREKVDYKYREIEIVMSIYIDCVPVAEGPEEVKKE